MFNGINEMRASSTEANPIFGGDDKALSLLSRDLNSLLLLV
jgi:hypothetical protein